MSFGKNSANNFMVEAINQAKIAFTLDEVPVGCVIVKDNKILSLAHNKNRQLKDPTAHAEIIAIREACQITQSQYLNNCDIYITLEPCLMCFMAISFARISRIYYGANDEKFGAIESNPILKGNKLSIFKSEVYSGIFANESIDLLKNFFLQKR